MEIENTASQVNAPLFGQNVLTIGEKPLSAKNDKEDGYGPAFQINLSKEAQTLSLKASKKDENNPFAHEVNEMLKDVFSGVAEALSYANEAGEEGSAEIKKAGEAFQQEILNIAKENNGKPLNEEQIVKILQADERFHQTVDKAFGFDEMEIDDFGIMNFYGDENAENSKQSKDTEDQTRPEAGQLGQKELAEQEATLAQAGAAGTNVKKANAALKARLALLEAQVRTKKAELKSAEASEETALKNEITRLETEVKSLKEKQKKA
ncbi:hypothetical protein [Curvivirga sp.]|uniref:hypothetical protein n=1 Tax=Curvivirga sp. TaxID=2856848 RepID=UPI003B591FAD